MLRRVLAHFIATAIALVATNQIVQGYFTVQPDISTDLGEYAQIMALSALIIGILNAIVKPILKLLSFPLMVATLGIFSIIINAAILWVYDIIIDSVEIEGFVGYMVVGIVLSICNWIAHKMFHVKNR